MDLLVNDSGSNISVNEEIFDCYYNEALVHQAVVTFMNNARSGNSAQKTRAEVRGGGRKPWKQKGTGRARAGTIRSPLWRTGGVIFAAKKRDYSQKFNKKMYKYAMRSIISQLHRMGNLVVVSDVLCDTPKTKEFLTKMRGWDISNALVVTKELTENAYYASRNLVEFYLCETDELTPFNLLRYEKVLITVEALKCLEERLQ